MTKPSGDGGRAAGGETAHISAAPVSLKKKRGEPTGGGAPPPPLTTPPRAWVRELVRGRELRTLQGHSSPVCGVAVSTDGRRAISASVARTLKIWDVERGRELRTLPGHSGWVNGVAVSADGRRAISASDDQTLR